MDGWVTFVLVDWHIEVCVIQPVPEDILAFILSQ